MTNTRTPHIRILQIIFIKLLYIYFECQNKFL